MSEEIEVQPEGFSAKVRTQAEYETVVDTFIETLSQRGRSKVSVDFSDLEENDE